ncbi:hypothetical protein [Gloeobacter morelensis]|uniref:Conjugal transfer protein TrbC n=1 Tax=Gloeobacter morelensis MG652769 TaxID=2781736 RepID=A0ABY3PG36_9CYAN|nr:hypothetical protein [Gloeobacter morelensis]UFP92611.1 hypothetical protein ISF26_12220 [Gloeobacter morelensis MG652769]
MSAIAIFNRLNLPVIYSTLKKFSPAYATAALSVMLLSNPAAAQLSNQIQGELNNRLPNAALGYATSMNTLVQFLLWVLAVVLVALCGFGVVEGINGRGWNKAFASVVGSVSIAILVAVVLEATK